MNDNNDNPLPPCQPKFNPGLLVITPGAKARLNPISVFASLARHLSGDWGDLSTDDKRANDSALKHDLRIFSAYHDSSGEKFWIITEADRASTTVLLSDEY